MKKRWKAALIGAVSRARSGHRFTVVKRRKITGPGIRPGVP